MKQFRDGVLAATSIITSTMGPGGRKVVLVEGRNHSFSRDGVTVSRKIMFPEPEANAGARAVEDACNATVKAGGDGTTTTAAILQGLIKGSMADAVESSTYEYVEHLKRAQAAFVDEVRIRARPCPDLDSVAVAAANNDVELGKVIAGVVRSVGADGFIKGERGHGRTVAEVRPGFALGSGSMLPQFLMNRPNLTLTDPYILIVEERITDYKQLKKLYEVLAEAKRPLVMVVAEIDSDSIRFVLRNMFERETPIPVVLIKSPYEGDNRYQTLKDLAEATGAELFSKFGRAFHQFRNSSQFGTCPSVEISMTEARFMVSRDLSEYVASITGDDDFTRSRISKLTTGVGVISIGGYTESEYKYQSEVVEDCVRACQAALREGVVLGGGAELYDIGDQFQNRMSSQHGSAIELQAWTCACEALKLPADIICENAGKTYTHYGNEVVDVITGERTRIWDSAAVVRECIQNAFSLAVQIIQSRHICKI